MIASLTISSTCARQHKVGLASANYEVQQLLESKVFGVGNTQHKVFSLGFGISQPKNGLDDKSYSF